MSKFIYLLNAMENAAQQKNPSVAGYGDKRRAVLEYVERLEASQSEAVEKGDPQNPVENAVDARRYRWLRDTGWPELSKLMLGMPMDVDAEIDAAMSSQSAPEGKECPDCGGTGSTPIGTCLRCGGTGSTDTEQP